MGEREGDAEAKRRRRPQIRGADKAPTPDGAGPGGLRPNHPSETWCGAELGSVIRTIFVPKISVDKIDRDRINIIMFRI